jgi:5-methylthioribose kinase
MLWVSRLERIWNERDAMTLLGSVLPEGTVPRVLFSDEPNYVFAMSCAPDDSVVWKEQLLAGVVDPEVGRRAGEVLGRVHASTRDHHALGGRLADTTVFDELRVDPFYRTVAKAHPESAPRIDALIASMSETPTSHRCLVLGDFSPKNILVHARGLTLVDFETAHAGDPAFDLGFFLSHLWLKRLRAKANDPGNPSVGRTFHALAAAFVEGYQAEAGPHAPLAEVAALGDPDTHPPLVRSPNRELAHLAACMLARVDGKSPVDYLDEPTRTAVRGFARGLLHGSVPAREMLQ